MQLPSASANFYQDIQEYRLPADSSCSATKMSFNTKFGDAKLELDKLRNDTSPTCLPNNVKFKEQIASLSNERAALVESYTKALDVFDTFVDSVDVLQNARGPIDIFMEDLKNEQIELEKEQYELQQKIRAGRRRFLDSDPQGGVQSILGLQTADDKILLAFWVCFILGIASVFLAFVLKYGENLEITNTLQKSTALVVLILVSIGIAHFFIRNYA